MALKPRTWARRVQSHCYRFSLFLIIVLIAVVLLAALYDIGQQIVRGNRVTKIADMSIAAASYVMVGVMAFFISLSRLVSIRRSVASMPKPYMPIQREDVPKKVHDLISSEYSRSALAFHMSLPKGRSLPGWGAAETPYEGMRFRKEILRTVDAMRGQLELHCTQFAVKEPERHTYSPRSSLLTPFLSTFFDPPAAALPAVCRPLIQSWDRHLENARWRREEPTMEDYEEVLRIVAVVIQLVGGSSSAPPLRDKVPSRTPSSGASVVVT